MDSKDKIIPKVWITKYAMTQGIIIRDNVEQCRSINDEVIYAGRAGCFHRPDWWTTEAEAIDRARVMIAAKLKSLDKQRAKLEALLKSPKITGK